MKRKIMSLIENLYYLSLLISLQLIGIVLLIMGIVSGSVEMILAEAVVVVICGYSVWVALEQVVDRCSNIITLNLQAIVQEALKEPKE